jgi:hypothetical protein
VSGVLPAKAAIFAQLKPIRGVFLVFHGVVIALLAFLAGKGDFDAHGMHLQKYRLKAVFSARGGKYTPGLPPSRGILRVTKKEPFSRGGVSIAYPPFFVKRVLCEMKRYVIISSEAALGRTTV